MGIIAVENKLASNIKINNSCLLEIYKNTVSNENCLGYTILPLANITDIETAIRNKVASSAPSGYTKLAILAGNKQASYNHRIIYCVWYKGETPPKMPTEPIIDRLPSVSAPLDVFEVFNVSNQGIKNTNIELVFNIIDSSDKQIEFYINDQKYLINNTLDYNYTMVVNEHGVLINNKPYDNFDFNNVPYLIPGENIIKIKKTNVSGLTINYEPYY